MVSADLGAEPLAVGGGSPFALLRGGEPIAYQVHPNLHLVEGHWPIRGNGEWVVGRRLLTRFPYLQPGTTFHYEHRDWKIVGVFADNDSARESEAWTDLDDLINDFHWDAGGAAGSARTSTIQVPIGAPAESFTGT